jgi:hypothetical protein
MQKMSGHVRKSQKLGTRYGMAGSRINNRGSGTALAPCAVYCSLL